MYIFDNSQEVFHIQAGQKLKQLRKLKMGTTCQSPNTSTTRCTFHDINLFSTHIDQYILFIYFILLFIF